MTRPPRTIPLGRHDLPAQDAPPGRWPAGRTRWSAPDVGRAAAGVAGVAAVAVGASGWIAVAALAAVGGWLPGAAGALAIAATQLRWGTVDLGAVAGDQDVLGAAVVVGPAAGWSSAVLGVVSLVAATRPGPRGSWSYPMTALLVGVVGAALWFRPWFVLVFPALVLVALVVGVAVEDRWWQRHTTTIALAAGALSAALAALV